VRDVISPNNGEVAAFVLVRIFRSDEAWRHPSPDRADAKSEVSADTGVKRDLLKEPNVDLLDRHALGQVARLIHVATESDREMIG
jgi:hypothetical protein